MRLPLLDSVAARDQTRPARSGFTLVEVLVASAVGMLVIAGAISFSYFAGGSFSGITAQCVLNGQAGYAMELIQTRAQLATSISNDASGNILTLGFDDDPNVDSNGDGIPYNDQNHFEQFKFLGVNTTDGAACSANSLVYIPNTAAKDIQVLIPKGTRNLPGNNIFTVKESAIAIVRFGIADANAQDNYQAIDIQGTAVALNRPTSTNVVSILP